MALLACFWLKILFVFSNARSIFKVMLRNMNLTKLDMLTLLSSNMTAPTLKTNEHLKKLTTHYLHFANSNLKVIFIHFILSIIKKLFHIWNLHQINAFNNIFIQSWLSKKWQKIKFFKKKLTFYELSFLFREIQMPTQVIWIFFFNFEIRCIF